MKYFGISRTFYFFTKEANELHLKIHSFLVISQYSDRVSCRDVQYFGKHLMKTISCSFLDAHGMFSIQDIQISLLQA